jgi:hypothetical protein
MRYQTDKLSIESLSQHGELVLRWHGRSEARDPAQELKPVLDAMGADLERARVVEFDFRAMEYMNSSTIRPILMMVQSTSARVSAVRVRYDGSKNWQRLSFLAIGAVLGTLDNVEVLA